MAQETYTFQAEIKQLLDILVHSLYSDREIFLRELISNASDALHRVQFEMLTNRDVADPDVELYVEIKVDEDAKTLTVSDTGIGMTEEDMKDNLGVIAKSGAKAFVEAMKVGAGENGNGANAADVIGQFGVGFYSAFMVADKVRVVSKSHLTDVPAFAWESTGGDGYTIEPAERETRGTDVILYLKDEDKEFLQAYRLKEIVRRHSDYVSFPIYVGGDEEAVNKQAAIWRQSTSEVTDEQYNDFYKMMTMDFNEPLHRIHMRADVPFQFYALLYIPSTAEPNMFSPRKEPGLKLYARKVLIQEYAKDLLPEYLQFVQGVVDSEDLPLNVSRETVQANRIMATLKKTITNKVLNELKRMAEKHTEDYLEIFAQFSRFIKQGVVVEPADKDEITPLLFFNSTHDDDPESFHSLSDYVGRLVKNQTDIYYVMGDDFTSARRSPHLDPFRQRGIEVLYFTDPVDAAMLMGLTEFDGHKLRNVDEADIDLRDIGEVPDESEEAHKPLAESDETTLVERFKNVLGKRVSGVRASKSLTGSPARLVSDDTSSARQMFRINRMLDREFQLPVKTLEVNPRHPLMHNLNNMLAGDASQQRLVDNVIEQVFETALLQDGIHPDPAGMADRILVLMQAATGTAVNELQLDDLLTVEEPEDLPSNSPLDGLDLSAMGLDEDAINAMANEISDATFADVDAEEAATSDAPETETASESGEEEQE